VPNGYRFENKGFLFFEAASQLGKRQKLLG
jgi:hypothetical protein